MSNCPNVYGGNFLFIGSSLKLIKHYDRKTSNTLIQNPQDSDPAGGVLTFKLSFSL